MVPCFCTGDGEWSAGRWVSTQWGRKLYEACSSRPLVTHEKASQRFISKQNLGSSQRDEKINMFFNLKKISRYLKWEIRIILYDYICWLCICYLAAFCRNLALNECFFALCLWPTYFSNRTVLFCYRLGSICWRPRPRVRLWYRRGN